MEHYDANDDGALELVRIVEAVPLWPPHVPVSTPTGWPPRRNELTDGLTQMYGSEMSLTEMNCTVTLKVDRSPERKSVCVRSKCWEIHCRRPKA